MIDAALIVEQQVGIDLEQLRLYVDVVVAFGNKWLRLRRCVPKECDHLRVLGPCLRTAPVRPGATARTTGRRGDINILIDGHEQDVTRVPIRLATPKHKSHSHRFRECANPRAPEELPTVNVATDEPEK